MLSGKYITDNVLLKCTIIAEELQTSFALQPQ